MQKAQKSGFGIVKVIIIIAAVAVLGGFFGYQYLKLQKIREEAPMPAAEPSAPPPVSTETRPKTNEIDTTNWETYRNEKYGFEVRYPSEWKFVKDKYGEELDFITKRGTDGVLALPTEGVLDPNDPNLEGYKLDWLRSNPKTEFRTITFGIEAGLEHGGTICEVAQPCTGVIYYYVYKPGLGSTGFLLNLNFLEEDNPETINIYETFHEDVNLVRNVFSTFKFIPLEK